MGGRPLLIGDGRREALPDEVVPEPVADPDTRHDTGGDRRVEVLEGPIGIHGREGGELVGGELMRQHVRAGRLHAAIRQFQRLRTILDRDLGLLPSPETVALYREILGTATSGWVRPALVGREVELVRARATLRRAAEGRPAAIFVSGRAGIGKTRVCEELVEQAGGEGWLVLRAAGREQTASVPYWPLVEAVQAAILDRPGTAEALGEPERALLARLTGLAAEQQRVPIHRHAVLHLVSKVIAITGARQAVLFIDDLHLSLIHI